MTVKGHLLKSASVIALVTVISRICGYLRDQRVALLLGTSPAADSLVLVFGIPNLIRRMSGEGALGAAFIPVFTGYLRRQAAGHGMVVRAKGILGHGGGAGSARGVGSGVLAADYSLLHDFVARTRRSGIWRFFWGGSFFRRYFSSRWPGSRRRCSTAFRCSHCPRPRRYFSIWC